MFNREDNILKLKASKIEEIIEDFIRIENYEQEECLPEIENVIKLFEDNLKGEYKDAMVQEMYNQRDEFLRVLEETSDIKRRAEFFKDCVDNGSSVTVRRNKDKVDVDPKADKVNARNLEGAIHSNMGKVYADYGVDSSYNHRHYELEQIIRQKERSHPPQDASAERELLNKLVNNKSDYKDLDNELDYLFLKTKNISEKFDDVNKVFETDLNDFDEIWQGLMQYTPNSGSWDMFMYQSFGPKDQGNPKYGHIPTIDEIPDEIKKFMEKYGLSLEDFIITEDGFITCTTSLNDILMQIDGFPFPDPRNPTYKWNSNWYLYAIIDENGKIHISGYRLEENNVAVSFVEMNEFLYAEDGSFGLKNLDMEELYIVCGENSKAAEASYFLTDYFENMTTDGSFVISDLMVNHVLNSEMTTGNTITVPGSQDIYNNILDEQDRDLLTKYGCYDPETGTITVGDPNNLTIDEYNTILLMTTGDSSSYAFDQENIYHAENAHEHIPDILGVGNIAGSIANGIDNSISDSGEVMNAGNGEGDWKEQIANEYLDLDGSYHNEDSDEIDNLKGEHPEGYSDSDIQEEERKYQEELDSLFQQ